MILAQATQPAPMAIDPTVFVPQEYLPFLRSVHPLAALMLIGLGGLCMVQGWKVFKILIALNAAAVGLVVGATVADWLEQPNMQVFLGIGGALVLAALSWPLMKGAVGLMGALIGGYIGFVGWRYAAHSTGYVALIDHAWAGALIGLITLALLSLVIFKTMVIVVTSLQGSAMMLTGVCGLAARIPGLAEPMESALLQTPHLLPLAVVILGILGVIYQESKVFALQQAKKKKAAAAAKSGG